MRYSKKKQKRKDKFKRIILIITELSKRLELKK